MSTNPTHTAPIRSNTPPFLKWFLNERAAIAGTMARLTDLETALAHKRDTLSKTLGKAEQKLAEAVAEKVKVQVSLDALTRTIELEYEQANPAAAGTVKAYAGKCGKRGGLRAYVARLVQSAPSGGISTTQLVNLCAQHFGIALRFPLERKSLRLSVKSGIEVLRKNGQVASVGNTGIKQAKNWHWIGDHVPSFEEMLRVEQEARSCDHTSHPDSA